MAQLIGVVSKVVGNVIAIAADGTRRTLVDGDRLYAGDVLETGDSGAVAVHLQNGQDMLLGRDSTVHMSADTLATNTVPHVEVASALSAPSASPLVDVDRIQAAIAAGQDPTVDADPTAAGTTPAAATGTSAGGGHSFVLLDAVGGAVAPTVGFDTAGVTGTVATAALFVNPLTATTNAVAVVDNPVSVPTSAAGTVSEANLADGSNPLDSALSRSGSFTISAPDGLTNLSIAGVAVLTNGVLTGLNTPITTALGNLITITGLNSANGAISYTYTLQSNETHPTGNGANNLVESVPVVAGDSNGSTGTGAITVNITDDLPTAVNDVNTDGVDENSLTAFGSVLDNDIQGADVVANGPVTPGTFTGIYGTLVLAADGTYTYTVNPNAPAFIALGNGGSGNDTFNYILTDSDGDSSRATLTVQVNNADSITISNSSVTVNEANLPLGSNPSAAALTQSSSFTVAATAGLSDLSINGTDIVSGGAIVGVNQPITTALGDTLTVTGVNLSTGVVSYSFKLNGAETHASGGGANNLALGLSVVAIDNNGTAVSNSITVNLTDDVPRAVADSNSTAATAASPTLTGNVLTNDTQGADRIASTGTSTGPITAGTFTGTYGTLALNANGSYTYTLTPSDPDFITLGAGGRGTESFTYTLRDADGDTSTATLTLNVANGTSTSSISITPVGNPLTVNEANLALGSAPNSAALTQNGTFNVAASAGLNSLSINGVAVLTNGVLVAVNQPITTALGNTLTVTGLNATTGVVSYSYTLARSETHASGNGTNSLPETISVTATDKANVSATGSISVNITDDVPRAVNDTATADASHQTVTGSVLSNDVQGADRMSGGPITPATLTGTYGNLVLNSSGNYIYTLNTNDPDYVALGSRTGSETFTYTLNDADGDTSQATLTINVAGAPGSVVISGIGSSSGDVTVNEANLTLGSSPNAAALTQTDTFVVTASNGFASLSVAGVAIMTNGVLVGLNQPINTALGVLTVTGLDATNGLVTYTYRLASNTASAQVAGANTASENISVVATDSSGTTATATIVAHVTDDVPTAVNDSNGTAADATHQTLTGNVLTNDTQGADRIASTGTTTGPVTAANLNGTYGTLQLNANGSYTYLLNTSDPDYVALGGRAGSETFTYTLRDSDGDTSTANLVLNIAGTGGSITISGIGSNDVAVNEANLALGSAPNAAALTQSHTFTVNASAGLNSLSVGGVAVLTNGVLVALNQPITTSLGNVITVTGLDATSGLVTYSYRLAAANNVAGTGANVVSENVQVVATDRGGLSTTGNIVANVTDDVPRAVNDTGASNLDATHTTLTGNVLSNDIQGADRIASTGTSTGPITATTLNGVYGSLVLNSSGDYTYTLNTNDPDYIALGSRSGTETFTYTLNDKDGDTSTATLTLTVAGRAGSISLPGIGSSDVTVNEANLALGSAPNAAALTQTHTFTVSATAGLSSLSIGGVTILNNGVLVALNQPITTSLGNTITVTGLDATTGLVTYNYQLTGNVANVVAAGANTVSESIAVRATDSLGNTSSGSLVANVVDDVPRAVNDTGASNLDATHVTLTGNVLSNDVQGADRIASTSTTTGPINAVSLNGTYGSLVLNANGSYTYSLNTSDPDYVALGNRTGSETFTYTLRDSDGDTSTATLTLNVTGSGASLPITGIGSSAGDVTITEANLALGSAPNSAALTQGGSFTVTTTAGLLNLSIAGVTVLSNGNLVNYGAPITTASGNTLRITGLNASNGVVTYTYTLNGNEAHPAGNGANVLTENLAVVASDRAGATGSSSIVVKVTDDVPTAVNDSNSTTADASHQTLTGNLLTNDVQGADRIAISGNNGPITAGTFSGTYGTLTISASGAYSYVLNTSDADFIALGANGRGTETFRYTLNDSDGDTSTANLVINVGGPASTITIGGIGNGAGDVSLNEANLALGSSPNSTALTKSGSFTVNTSAGLSNLSIAGVTVLSNGNLVNYGAPITTASGNTLRITGLNASNGVVTYTYTLVANEAHPTGNGANVLTENLAVNATDRAGATASGTIVVKVTDDVPTAVNDSNSTTADASHLTLTGNVLSNDTQGADRISSGPITSGSFNGSYGTLLLNANGTYTYTLNTGSAAYRALTNGAHGTETFTYTLKDSDGDTSTAVLSIDVGGASTSTIVIGGIGSNDVTVNEANLALGSAPNAAALTQSHSFTVNASAGLSSLSVGGVAILTNGVLVALNQPITTSLGNTITVTGLDATAGTVTYSYKLTGNTANAAVAGANTVTENIAVSATDSTGKSVVGSIVANVIDDVPRAVNDSNTTAADESHLTLTGNVLSNDVQGADRISAGPISAGTFTGTYGTLVLRADGSYTYTLNSNGSAFKSLLGGTSAAESFVYTLNDSDGDTSTATLNLNINNLNDPVTIGGLGGNSAQVTVFEANLANGSSPDSAGLTRTGTFTVTAPDGLSALTINGTALVSNGTLVGTLPAITGALGNTLTITGYNATTGVVSYSYHLNSNELQAAGASAINELFTVTAADRDGSTASSTLSVNIINDAPIAVNDVAGALVSATSQTVSGNVLSNDVLGADRVAGGPVVSGNFTGTYGNLVLNPDGTYTYTLNTNDADFKALASGQFATDNFTYTLRDADGDTSAARLQVQISGGAAPVVTVFRTLVVADDSGTASGTAVTQASNSSDFTASTLQTIAFTGAGTNLGESLRTLERADFTALSGGMAAALLVTGYLAATTAAGQVDQESFSVSLKQGETLTLDPSNSAQLGLQLVLADGSTQTLSADHAFTATQDGTYTLHVTNASTAGTAEDYSLGVTIGATTAIYSSDTATGTATDAHYAVAADTTTAATLTAASTGDHVLAGSDGNDVLTAGAGNDSLFGGKGDDLLIAGSGNDLLNGGDGNDTVSYQNATAGVHVSLAIAGQQNVMDGKYDTLVSIENLIGSSHDDVLIGNDKGNVLNGGLGNDTLIGGSGNDTLIGGMGNNTLTGGGGSDTFLWQQGNTGHDTVTDFKPGSNTLDLSQLLQGHSDANSLDDYLHFQVTGTGDNLMTTIQVSSSAAATPTQTIDLQGVNLAHQYGVAAGASGAVASNDAATIINGMLTDHSLKVDTV
ncbi:retention module-containing protein [Pseudomonas sp. HR96]|uniref:retention module-containing protein n=1 Tax=Pseudomonas sp. HR96 TaxID=1027966 RepID=UPI002A75BBD1|nr:retention module-containing protein [Pseudomonas sp. HR96]WPO98927.1 retention module-containing protein [Pseudomonas sp. HR96]